MATHGRHLRSGEPEQLEEEQTAKVKVSCVGHLNLIRTPEIN